MKSPTASSTGSHRRHQPNGYTLLELMIVMAILVAVALVAWPRIIPRLQLVGPRDAALQLRRDLDEAREQAVLSAEPWIVRIQRGTPNYEMGPVTAFREREELSRSGVSSSNGDHRDLSAGMTSVPLARADGRRPTSPPQMERTTETSVLDERIRARTLPVGMVFQDGFADQTRDVIEVRDAAFWARQAQAARQQPPSAGLQDQSAQQLSTFDPEVQTSASSPEWKYAVIYQADGRATDSEISLRDEMTQKLIRLRVRGFTGGVTIGKVEPPRLAEQPATEQQQALQDSRPSMAVPAPNLQNTESRERNPQSSSAERTP